MHQDWTKENTEVMHRNNAIRARNRCMAEHGEYLGLSTEPMALEPMPTAANDHNQQDN